MVRRLSEKTAFAVNDSSRSWQIKNYRYGPLEEEEYFLNLQRHRFGDTRRKGGYDCLRHYELLASGCVPILDGLEHLPASILTTLPRSLLARSREVFGLPWVGTEDGPGACASACIHAYDRVANELLNYTAGRLTTEAAARRILLSLDIPVRGAKVLFLPCVPIDNFPSFLAASVFHGLVSLLGDGVIDVPEYDYVYEYPWGPNTTEEVRLRSNMWGQGFTLGFRLPRRPHINRQNISERIRATEFDLIVFARMSPYEPCNFWYDFAGRVGTVPQHFEDIFHRYPRERVVLLYGDDSGLDDAVVRTHVSRMSAQHRGVGYAFMRELLPFVAEGPPGEALRPVDGELLQAGCFYREWLEFFELWRPAGLRDCAVWGLCGQADVQEYMRVNPQLAHHPPVDPPVLKHFCRTGFLLMSALLVQWLGPQACLEDGTCANFCRFGLGMYSRHLLDLSPQDFHGEFGVTGTEVVFVLSQGCQQGTVALQPAFGLRRHGVAILAHPPAAGPLAGEWQVAYLLTQGFHVTVARNSTGKEFKALQSFRRRGQLRFLPLQPGSPCAWLHSPELRPLHYAHLERAAAVECLLAEAGAQWLPPFASVQLPGSAPGTPHLAGARAAVAQLTSAGYRRFKASQLGGRGLGGPVGDLAADSLSGERWRSAGEVLGAGSGLAPGGQLHAAL